MTQFVEANNAVFRYEHVGNAEGAGARLCCWCMNLAAI